MQSQQDRARIAGGGVGGQAVGERDQLAPRAAAGKTGRAEVVARRQPRSALVPDDAVVPGAVFGGRAEVVDVLDAHHPFAPGGAVAADALQIEIAELAGVGRSHRRGAQGAARGREGLRDADHHQGWHLIGQVAGLEVGVQHHLARGERLAGELEAQGLGSGRIGNAGDQSAGADARDPGGEQPVVVDDGGEAVGAFDDSHPLGGGIGGGDVGADDRKGGGGPCDGERGEQGRAHGILQAKQRVQ